MKYKSTLLLAIILLASNAFSQPKIPSKKDVANFYESTTYVLLNNDLFGTYNTNIKEAVKRYWTLTPTRYINKYDFKKKKKFPLASFIIETTTNFENQESLGVFSSLSVLGGHRSGDINQMPDLATLPLAYNDVGADDYQYKFGLAIKFIQKHIEWIKANPNTESQLLFEHYKKSRKKTKGKTLYLRKSEVEEDLQSLSAIKEVYSGKVKMASADEIEKVINSNDPNALVLHLVAPDTPQNKNICIKMIIGVADAELYYFNYHLIKKRRKPGVFLKSDFKTIQEF